MDIIFQTWYGGLGIMLISSIVIAKACDLFEASADYLGRNMNDGVKGATLNAIGSSMPELLTTAFFLLFASQSSLAIDFAASIGGDTGSAIFNSIVIPMVVIWVVLLSFAGIKGVKISKKVILRDGLFLLTAEILLLVLLSSSYLTHWHGWIFTSFYLIYLSYTLISMKKNPIPQEKDEIDTEEHEEEQADTWFEKYLFKSPQGRTGRSWVLLTLSTIVIAIACAGLVEGCKGFAHDLGINPLFVALILVAAASSLPDTIISLKDAKKGNYDDALSNVLGSNIFDITISMGFPLALFLLFSGKQIDFREAGSTLIDIRIILLIITSISIIIFYKAKQLGRKHVFMLAILYLIFISYAIGAAYHSTGSTNAFTQFIANISEHLNGVHQFLQKIADALFGY